MAVRTVLLLLLAGLLLQAQNEDIYQRAKQTLGEAGEADLRAKNFSRVEDRLAEMKPASENDRADWLALRGAVAFLEGKMAQAVDDFRESERILPAREEDRFTLAMALLRLGRDSEARAVLTDLQRQHATKAIYWYWLGRLDYYQRRYSEAVENLETAVKLDPKAARAWDSLGLAWDMQGQMEQAREMFEKAVTLNRAQTQPSAWPPHDLGYLLLRSGETVKAEEALRESLHYDANLVQTHYYLARVLEKEDRADEAIMEYRFAVAGDLESADSCYSLAILYRKLHRDSEAQAMFDEFKKRKASSKAPPSP